MDKRRDHLQSEAVDKEDVRDALKGVNDAPQQFQNLEDQPKILEVEQVYHSKANPTAILLIGGITLVLAGFATLATTVILQVLRPESLFVGGGMLLFACGVGCIIWAWHRLS